MNNRGTLAISQILILMIGILAISYAVGSSVGVVSGTEKEVDECTGYGNTKIKVGETLCLNEAEQTCKKGGKWSKAIFCKKDEICSAFKGGKCVKEELIIEKGQAGDDLPLPLTPESEVTFKKGFEFTDSKGKTEKIPDQADTDDDGELGGKEILAFVGSGWATYNMGKGILGELGKLGGKEGAKIFSKTAGSFGKGTMGEAAQAVAGPVIGAFLAWAFFKWILKGDVRNMRDITIIAVTTGGIGVTVALIAVAAGAGPVGWIIGGIVLAVVLLVGLAIFKNYSSETFAYIVTAWKAPVGGDFCEKCNDLEYGCGEYQCKSFGKACELENVGSENEICIWKNPDDILAPVITALDKVLPSTDYTYKPLDVVQGVKIEYSKDLKGKGCIPPYSSVTLGIETNEFAECKIDTERTPNFEDMISPMEKVEGFAKEHILLLPHIATPSVESQIDAGISETQITNGQAQEFFIRCEDPNGNSNLEEFIMEFCVQEGPDTQAPRILGTNFLATSYLQFNQTSANLEVYTNEPAECNWDFDDKDYDQMQFNMDTCSLGEGEYLFSGFRYGCKGTLQGLKDRVENKFYIRCKDKPWWSEGDEGQRFANEISHVLTLLGTQPLLIDSITANGKPNGSVIKDSTNIINVEIEVKTSAGAQQGKAKCSYQFGGPFIDFYNKGVSDFVNVNIQNLYLSEGDYTIPIKCRDAGGNTDQSSIDFTIDTDREPPIVVRAYYDANNLRILTDENSECVYNTNANIGCDYVFDDGTEMTNIRQLAHYTPWEPNKKYHIKCKDVFGNYPLPGKCSIVVRAFESYTG